MRYIHRKTHNIEYERELNIGIATYIRAYHNGGKPHCDTLFFYVEFREYV